ncbi:hypothetical protein PSPO01_02865 [Paraphaeosphaeria sporulosa]
MSRYTDGRSGGSPREDVEARGSGTKCYGRTLSFMRSRKTRERSSQRPPRRSFRGGSCKAPAASCLAPPAPASGETGGPGSEQKTQVRRRTISSSTPPARRIATKHTYRASLTGCLRYACFGRKSPDIGSNDPRFQQRTAIEARPPHINIRLAPATVCTLCSFVIEARVEELAPGRRYESAGFRSMPPTA